MFDHTDERVRLAAALPVAEAHPVAALVADAEGEGGEVWVDVAETDSVVEEPNDTVGVGEFVTRAVAGDERDVLAERDADTVALSLTVTLEEREDDGLAAGDAVTRALSEALGDLRDEGVTDCDDDTDGD